MRTTEYVYRIANPIMLKKRHCKCRLTGVIPVAKEIGAEYWTGFNDALSEAENLANNRTWIKTKLSEGHTVIDIGLDPKYVTIGNLDPGPYYSMELFEVFGIK
ncbi:MAG: hypothetical protein LBT27_08090 [Prevotellaceae bacterium]|jgi:hypothetical protein|nr:hypothetical protein [Prevotellaceae bacterium]